MMDDNVGRRIDAVFVMEAPEFDRDGYPTETTTAYIASCYAWPVDAYREWMTFCLEALHKTYASVRETPKRIAIATGGWSGNEAVIIAMSQNFLFHRFWISSKRGGLHVYESIEEVEAGYARVKAQNERMASETDKQYCVAYAHVRIKQGHDAKLWTYIYK